MNGLENIFTDEISINHAEKLLLINEENKWIPIKHKRRALIKYGTFDPGTPQYKVRLELSYGSEDEEKGPASSAALKFFQDHEDFQCWFVEE